MRKNDGWLNMLYMLIFIASPAIVGFMFLLPDMTGKEIISYGYIWLTALAFIFYSFGVTIFFIKIQFITIESMNFNIPIAIVFGLIMVSYPLNEYFRMFIVLLGVFTAVPVNIYVDKRKRN